MNFYENNEVANLITNRLNSLITRKLNDKYLVDVKSGGINNATRCYFFVDKDIEKISRTNKEKIKSLNLYDVEILFVRWTYCKNIIDKDLFIDDVKEFSISKLIVDCNRADYSFLDSLYEEGNCDLLMKVYAYDNKAFNNIEEIIEYEKRRKS